MATTFDSMTVTDLAVLGTLLINGVPFQGEVNPGPLPIVPDSEATSNKQLVEDFNNLLAALRQAGVIG